METNAEFLKELEMYLNVNIGACIKCMKNASSRAERYYYYDMKRAFEQVLDFVVTGDELVEK